MGNSNKNDYQNYDEKFYIKEKDHLKKAVKTKGDLITKINSASIKGANLLSDYNSLKLCINSSYKNNSNFPVEELFYDEDRIYGLGDVFTGKYSDSKINRANKLFTRLNDLINTLKTYSEQAIEFGMGNGENGDGNKGESKGGNATKNSTAKKSSSTKSKFYSSLMLVSGPTVAKKVSSTKSAVTMIGGVTAHDEARAAENAKLQQIEDQKTQEAVAKKEAEKTAALRAEVEAKKEAVARARAQDEQEAAVRLAEEKRQQETSLSEQSQQPANAEAPNQAHVSRSSYNYNGSNNESSAESQVQDNSAQNASSQDTTSVETPKEDVSTVKEDTVIIDDEVGKVSNSHGGSKSHNIVPGVLGVAAAGAATVAGVRYIKNRDKDNYNVDDYEDDYENDDSYTAVSNEDNSEPVEKYQAGNINNLNLEQVDDIKIEDDYDFEDDFDQELE